MEYRKETGAYYIRIDPGEDVMETIVKVCEENHVFGGSFQGIGACGEAVLSTYLPTTKEFQDHVLTGMLEMASLTGNVTKAADGKIGIHAHAVFSYLDGQKISTVGGHLTKATVSYTGEIVLRSSESPIGQRDDLVPGVNVWDLGRK